MEREEKIKEYDHGIIIEILGFEIKIPSEFKITGNEIVNVKYPNRNASSIIFNYFVSIFNINRVLYITKKLTISSQHLLLSEINFRVCYQSGAIPKGI